MFKCYYRPISPDSGGLSKAAPVGGDGVAASPVQPMIGCRNWPEAAPEYYAANNLPQIPIKTVRLIFHIMQDNDGTGNFQSPQQDGGADEALLLGLVSETGLANWQGGPIKGINHFFGHLDNPLFGPGPAPAGSPTPATAPLADTRIRFVVEQVRYYRDRQGWDMSSDVPSSCYGRYGEENGCYNSLYEKYVTNTVANPGQTSTSQGQLLPIPSDLRDNAIHIFMGEHPGAESLITNPFDEFGNRVSRYRSGGVAMGLSSRGILLRGFYWTLLNHPHGSPASATNKQNSFVWARWNIAHELGHTLGLEHSWDGQDSCTGPGNGPPAFSKSESNNVMDYPTLPGLALSQCQIGKMHTALNAGYELPGALALRRPYVWSVHKAQVRDHCEAQVGQDVIVKQNQTWNTIHNLRGNLYIERGITLFVNCRLGFAGTPTAKGGKEAKIVVRSGGKLILREADLGTYRTSDTYECPAPLTLLLGGKPGDLDDLDNGGLIELEDRRNTLTTLTQNHLAAFLTPGASLHIGNSAGLTFDGAVLTAQSGSFLCVESFAALRYLNNGDLKLLAGATHGVRPGITITPTPTCQSTVCDITAQSWRIETAVGSIGACPGMVATLAVAGVRGPGYTYSWAHDGVALNLAGNPSTYDATLTNTTAGYLIHVYTCTISKPGSGCPPVTLTQAFQVNPGSTPPSAFSTVSICLNGTSYNYKPNGTYDLNALIPQLAPGQIDLAWRNSPYLTNGQLDLARARQVGPQVVVALCHTDQPVNNIIQCATCQDITITLDEGPDFGPPAAVPEICAGQPLLLNGSASGAVSYDWQPGDMTGPQVSVAPTKPTTYTVTATNADGCQSRRTFAVPVRPASCADCLDPGTTVEMDQGDYAGGYLFENGRTYHFPITAHLAHGQYRAEPGSRLIFEPGAGLELLIDCCFEAEGAEFTGSCEEMWRGITLLDNATFAATNCKISYSEEGIALKSYPEGGSGCAPEVLSLQTVEFWNNRQGVQADIKPDFYWATPPVVRIADCQFDSDGQDHLSYRHVMSGSDNHDFQLTGNIFKHALVGVWNDKWLYSLEGNQFTDCYLAGVYSPGYAAQTWLNNTFTLPTSNTLAVGSSPLVAQALAAARTRENNATQLLPGFCFGAYSSTGFVDVRGGSFTGAAPLQVGLYAGPNLVFTPQPGAVRVQEATFTRLPFGVLAPAEANASQVRGNRFEDCRTGLYFQRTHLSRPAGTAQVSCNTFARTGAYYGTNHGIYLGPVPFGHGQVDFTSGTTTPNGNLPRLQKNAFEGTNSGNANTPNNSNIFWHLYNSSGNTPITYGRYGNKNGNVSYTVPNTLDALDGHVGPYAQVTVASPVSTRLGATNNCTSDNFPDTGLQRPSGSATSPLTTSTPKASGFYLQQNTPNPCSGSTIVAYRVPKEGSSARLLVRDAYSGRPRLEQALASGEHTLTLNVSTLPPGIYVYTLEIDGRPVANHKLLVQ